MKVIDTLKATVINSLNLDEYASAFETAVSLRSESWPWLTTYITTNFEPIQIVQQYKSLRHIAINLEPNGFMSAWMLGIFESTSRIKRNWISSPEGEACAARRRTGSNRSGTH